MHYVTFKSSGRLVRIRKGTVSLAMEAGSQTEVNIHGQIVALDCTIDEFVSIYEDQGAGLNLVREARPQPGGVTGTGLGIR